MDQALHHSAFENVNKKNLWTWSNLDTPAVCFSKDHRTAYFYTNFDEISQITVAAKSDVALSSGHHYWEVELLEPPSGASVMVGIGTERAALTASDCKSIDLLGSSDQSWGLSYKGTVVHDHKQTVFCEPFYDGRTIVGVELDLEADELRFHVNQQCLGVAFRGLRSKRPLYPMVSVAPSPMDARLQSHVSTCSSLQRLATRCISDVMTSVEGIESLPLPKVLKNQIACDL